MKFQIPYDKVQERTIVLHVMDKDKLSKDDKMGEVQIQLGRIDLSKKTSVSSLDKYIKLKVIFLQLNKY